VKTRLHIRLLLWNLLLIVITLGVLDLILNSSLTRYLEAQVEQQLRRDCTVAGAYLAREPTPGRSDDVVDELSEMLNVRVTLIAEDGRVLGDSELDGIALENVGNHADRPEVLEAKRLGIGKSVRQSATTQKKFMYVAKRLDARVLRLAMPLTEVAVLIGELRFRLIIATVVSLVLMLLFGYAVSLKLSRPIREIAHAAKRLATGDLTHRLPAGGDDEIAGLRAALNTMAENLSSKIHELSEGKQRLELILGAMGEGIMVLDRTGRIGLTNRSMLEILRSEGGLVGRSPQRVFRNEAFDRAVRRVLEDSQGSVVELTSESGRVLRAHITPVSNESGGLEAAVIVFHDLTDIRRIEKMRRDFVANVSHEFKTPLTSIRGYAETLLTRAGEDPDLKKEFLTVIERNARQLETLVSDLLTLAKIESELVAKKEQVELRSIIGEELAGRQTALAQRGIRVSLDCPTIHVQADRALLVTAISNLLDNAINYNRPGGKIEIAGYLENSRAFVLDITDTGIGIPAEELPRIFERFYRVDKARSRSSGATGLGLAIAKHAIESQGGRVTVTSRVGVGSTFTIRLGHELASADRIRAEAG
jgi:two-component system, OmpR family, phosphate regulon sensor histidine kinase PhoR